MHQRHTQHNAAKVAWRQNEQQGKKPTLKTSFNRVDVGDHLSFAYEKARTHALAIECFLHAACVVWRVVDREVTAATC